jgi:hypothetical protein
MTPMNTDNNAKPRWDLDAAGMTASLACAVHCAAMPLVITLLPLVGLGFLANEWVEWLLVGLSALLGVASLCLGYRHHRSRRAFAILSVGLAFIVIGRIAEERDLPMYGVPFLVFGGCVMAAAHWVNRRLCHSCHRCNPHG